MRLTTRIVFALWLLFAAIIIGAIYNAPNEAAIKNHTQIVFKKENSLIDKAIEPVLAQRAINSNISVDSQKQAGKWQQTSSHNTIHLENQRQKLIEYIYTKSFLCNKQKIAFHFLLSQIQPNAP